MRTLHENNKDNGFSVLAFPCNQFGAQEPGSNAEIKEFATSKYDATFPMFAKTEVNGDGACDLYNYLKAAQPLEVGATEGSADIAWNFAKFLVDRNGKAVARFSPKNYARRNCRAARKLALTGTGKTAPTRGDTVSMRKTYSSGSNFEEEFAYSRVVVDGDWVMVSGTTGYDYEKMSISPDPASQAIQCFENIKTALANAEARLEDIVRITYLVPDRGDVPAFAPVFRTYLGDIKPAATMLVTQLLNSDMKIEIEVTAIKSSDTI